MPLSLSSGAFPHEGPIPSRYTCDGEDVSPPLSWDWVPEGTAGLVLIMADPDAPDPRAPKRTWIHWVLYNIPTTVQDLSQAMDRRTLPPGTREGLNDWRRPGYNGPCPPIGRHRYFFRLYAVDILLPDEHELTASEVQSEIEGHVLEMAELMGTYEKKGTTHGARR